VSVLLQISDTHFGTEQAPVVEALERFVHTQAVEAVILSGDVTQRATRAQFDAARRFVERLAVPRLLAIPGNHDIPLFNLAARAVAPYANFRRVFGEALEPVFDSPRWQVQMVNTTRARRHKDGEVSAQQIERVARRLEQARPSQVRIVVVHQPVAVTNDEDRHNLLHGREAALRRWSASGVDLILGGHIHLPFVLPLHEAHAGLARRLWVVQAGTAVSSRLRRGAANSVNLIRHDDAVEAGCVVERWDFRAQAAAFDCADRRHLSLGSLRDAARGG